MDQAKHVGSTWVCAISPLTNKTPTYSVVLSKLQVLIISHWLWWPALHNKVTYLFRTKHLCNRQHTSKWSHSLCHCKLLHSGKDCWNTLQTRNYRVYEKLQLRICKRRKMGELSKNNHKNRKVGISIIRYPCRTRTAIYLVQHCLFVYNAHRYAKRRKIREKNNRNRNF
jgi:hypothetical protein